ncbi:MAG: twin-arginine translocase subunit TatB [Betaproteobacteria bacterium]|nr:MAG: twin-arginine translocase subunit TatB [Betaproteobacteria bacterium]
MFELSFGKMMIIAVVALIVLGPERLPKVARTLGHLLGRARSYANQVKQDIDREMQMDELRKLQEQAKDAARSFETAVNDVGRSVESEASTAEKAFNEINADYDAKRAREAATQGSVAKTDEVAALEQSIAEQAMSANSASNAPANTIHAPAAKPMITSEQMNSSLAPAWPTQKPASDNAKQPA